LLLDIPEMAAVAPHAMDQEHRVIRHLRSERVLQVGSALRGDSRR
jgi:hypothetical protein